MLGGTHKSNASTTGQTPSKLILVLQNLRTRRSHETAYISSAASMSHSNDQSLWDQIRVEFEECLCVHVCVFVCGTDMEYNLGDKYVCIRNVQTHILVRRYETEGRANFQVTESHHEPSHMVFSDFKCHLMIFY